MDPKDYDIDELQEIADDPMAAAATDGQEGMGGSGTGRADGVVESNQYRELMLLENTIGETEKPYLDSLPETYAAELVLLEWLEFLIEKAGFKRTLDTLRYYRSIGWLDEAVEDRLQDYLRSFDDGGERADLDRSDHVLSLVYVARLASMAE